eukprot:TRINITY_DN5870_c0_g1_i1.p1 TRINITY_DN5870_c0_g1~~TRINITY_DN5870_c0_g1_i1.p1  ORF type:complete len:103 (+),score=2.65 TRINITY_DN5870_c0_g1_i1:70-378(+)
MLASYSLLQHNLRNVPCQKSGKDWLRSAPRGAYTAIRTVGRDKIFEFTFHINRLTESVRLMGQLDVVMMLYKRKANLQFNVIIAKEAQLSGLQLWRDQQRED